MAASRRKKKQRKEKFEKALTAVLCGIVAVLVLLAAVISLSEENGGAMPTWQQLYSWFGVAAPVPHLPEEAAGAATKIHFIDATRETPQLSSPNSQICSDHHFFSIYRVLSCHSTGIARTAITFRTNTTFPISYTYTCRRFDN